MEHIKSFEEYINESTDIYPGEIGGNKKAEKIYDKFIKWEKLKEFKHDAEAQEESAPLDKVLKATGLSIKELEELEKFGDYSWAISIDKDENTVTVYLD